MKIVALDQSTGSRSDFGFCVVEMDTMDILVAKAIKIKKDPDLRKRIKLIAAHIAAEFKLLEQQGVDYAIFIEQYVMMGKGGESLQRLNGALMVVAPSNREMHFINNLQVKKFVTGSGKAEKRDIAMGLLEIFKSNKNSVDLINNLMVGSNWDALDAIAIGVTGYEKIYAKQLIYPVSKK